MEDNTFTGCIYANEPDNEFYKLSKQELSSLRLAGLPMRVEHNEKDIGKVLDSWVDEKGHVFVHAQLTDDPRGWGMGRLVENGKVQEMSLLHELYPDGTIKPIEVSFVKKGARPNTTVSKTSKYITASAAASTCPPAMEPAPIAAEVPPAQHAPPPVAAPAEIVGEKRTRDESGRFLAAEKDAGEHEVRRNKMKVSAENMLKVRIK